MNKIHEIMFSSGSSFYIFYDVWRNHQLLFDFKVNEWPIFPLQRLTAKKNDRHDIKGSKAIKKKFKQEIKEIAILPPSYSNVTWTQMKNLPLDFCEEGSFGRTIIGLYYT